MSKDMIKLLEDDRVYLRPLEQEDLDLFYTKALWDREGRRLTGTQTVFSRKGVQHWFDRISMDDSRVDLVIFLQETDQLIGDIAMLDIDYQNRKSVFRISIFDKKYWGYGYGTESISLLLRYGFEMLNMNRIGLDVFSFNKRALKCYQNLGFREEGRLRDDLFYDGKYHDSIVMSILKREFHESP
ncbi:GNAT family protein [Halobacillus litoralis]|uniref:GNAT family N-acetyltransferase n=1 Tax=Halobacillus litoralis TaxID=45668 RepID=UPI001CFCAC55|nr:GNAT family protein [Halobacillus litoralis]WLR46645.1 GNAT family protein [Halobacillus litoralis]